MKNRRKLETSLTSPMVTKKAGIATDESMAISAFREYSAQLESDYNPVRFLGIEVPHCLKNIVRRCVSGQITFIKSPPFLFCYNPCSLKWQDITHFGCVIGTSKMRSSGISKSSGSFPLACSRRGRTSKRPFGAFHPSCMQI